MAQWTDVCAPDDVELEECIKFSHASKIYAVFRSPEGEFFCTDGICTHEHVDLTEGLVMDHTIECPKHSGVFDYRTGEALRAPVCINLKAYPARSEKGRIQIEI